jgi:excisionase family DNA binding protein
MSNECDFFSIKEFAAKVGVHPMTIRRAIKRGRITAIKIGGNKYSCYRIAKTELDRIALFDLEDIVNKMVEKKMQESSKVL